MCRMCERPDFLLFQFLILSSAHVVATHDAVGVAAAPLPLPTPAPWSPQPYACAMWEFSWMDRRVGAQNEYADWGAVLDELVDRGYDCIRFDAFPHLVAAGPGVRTIQPVESWFMWGNSEQAVIINPQQHLVEFMKLGVARKLKFGLSTWFRDDETHQRDAVKTPDDLLRIWQLTLRHIDSNVPGGLSNVLWVDLCNEFPVVGQWSPSLFKSLTGRDWPVSSTFWQNLYHFWFFILPWSEWTSFFTGGLAIQKRANEFLTEVIPKLKQEFQKEVPPPGPAVGTRRAANTTLSPTTPGSGPRFTFSMFGVNLMQHNLQSLDISHLDFVELHLWLSDNFWFLWRSGETAMFSGPAPDNLLAFAPKVDKLYQENQEFYKRWLKSHLDGWHGWAVGKYGKELVTTEAWGPINYNDVPGDSAGYYWGWVKDIGEVGLKHALCLGWRGVATSNFAEPHFRGMWADADWHRRMTGVIKGFEPRQTQTGVEGEPQTEDGVEGSFCKAAVAGRVSEEEQSNEFFLGQEQEVVQ